MQDNAAFMVFESVSFRVLAKSDINGYPIPILEVFAGFNHKGESQWVVSKDGDLFILAAELVKAKVEIK